MKYNGFHHECFMLFGAYDVKSYTLSHTLVKSPFWEGEWTSTYVHLTRGMHFMLQISKKIYLNNVGSLCRSCRVYVSC